MGRETHDQRKDTADMIADRLTDEGHSVASLHAGKETANRDDVLDSFRNGKTKVLITTNVVARGIDISQVNMVVNYDVPMDQNGVDLESYIHRIGKWPPIVLDVRRSQAGRTGRFGRKGCSVIFAHDNRSRQQIEEIQERLGGKPMKKIDARSSGDIEALEKVSSMSSKHATSCRADDQALKAALKGPA